MMQGKMDPSDGQRERNFQGAERAPELPPDPVIREKDAYLLLVIPPVKPILTLG